MSVPSSRDVAFGGIIAISCMSFLAGVFLMSGVNQSLKHDPIAALSFVLIPAFAFVITLHSRRILKQFAPEPGQHGSAGNE
jgi:hypothetical protein